MLFKQLPALKNAQIKENIFFLGLVQGINYLVPLILIPLLLVRIGLEPYGVVVLAQGIMHIFIAYAEYGCGITATRMISQTTSQKKQGEIIVNILMAKLILLPFGFLLLLLLVMILPVWRAEWQVILGSYTMVIGTAFFPNWYFMGIGKTALLSLFTFISRILYLTAVFICINTAENYQLVNIFNGLGTLIVAGIALAYIKKDIPAMAFSGFRWTETIRFLKQNAGIFLSNLINSGYRSCGILLAGFLLNPTLLGIYGVLDKVLSMVINGFIVVFNAVFPTVCSLAVQNTSLVWKFFRKHLPRFSLVILCGAGLMGFAGPEVLTWLSPDIGTHLITVEWHLVTLFPLVMLLNLPVSLTLASMNLQKELVLYHAVALLMMIVLGTSLGYTLQISGLLASVLLTELIIFMVGYGMIRYRKLSPVSM